MIPALLLAAAAAASAPTGAPLDEGCRLVRRAPPTVKRSVNRPAPAASTASAPSVRARPKLRRTFGLFPPPADYDLVCDHDAPAPTFTPVPPPPINFWLPEQPYTVPEVPPTFETTCDCTQPMPYLPPGSIAIIGAGPYAPAPPMPEPSIWAVFLAGAGIIYWRRR